MTDLFSEKAMDWDGRDTIRELSAGNGASILSSRRTSGPRALVHRHQGARELCHDRAG